MSQDEVAWHGRAELLHWQESSNQGAKIQIGLADRNELTYFEAVTRRNRRRAGQRFRCFWQDENGDPANDMPEEVWFAGAQWSHTQGAKLAFWITPEDLETIKGIRTRDQKLAPRGIVFFLALVELTAEDEPVNQRQRSMVEDMDRPRRLQGGPVAKNAGMLCEDADFQAFVASQTGEEASAEAAADWVRSACQVASRAELDHNDEARARYETWVKRPFLAWADLLQT